MPGTGTFGGLYPGGFGPEEANDKTGTAVSAFVGSGADATTHAETGSGVAPLTAAGVGALAAFVKAGVGIAPLTGGGEGSLESLKAGSGASAFTAAGVGNKQYVKTGTGIKVHDGTAANALTYTKRNVSTVFGAPHDGTHFKVASGSNEKSTSKAGRATMGLTARGRQGDAVAGSGIAGFSVSGHKGGSTNNQTGAVAISVFTVPSPKLADILVNKTGFSSRGLAATAANAITYVETGAGISARAASGTSGKAGAAASPFAASGARAVVYTETGAAVMGMTGNGFLQPHGVAVIVFSGGGNLRQLYANDNFVNREIIDFPTGDLELDAGSRLYQLAGRTERATNETGERRTEISTGSFSNTLWWEYTVPFRCIVRFNIVAVDMAGFHRAVGEAHLGDAVGALTQYADPRLHFGQDSGRGLDSSTMAASGWGAFPAVNTTDPVSIQVEQLYPIKFNAGKSAGVAASQHLGYVITVERLAPPDNHDVFFPLELAEAGGVTAWDFAAATNDPRWDWDQLDEIMYRPDNNRITANLFYRYTPTMDSVFRFQVETGVPTNQRVQALVFEGENIETWVPIELDIDEVDTYAVPPGTDGYVEFPAELGKSYIIALLQGRSVLTFSGSVISMAYTTREFGTLTWETVQNPSNDDWENRVNLADTTPTTTFVADSRGSTAQEGEPLNIYTNTAKGIWYEYTPPLSGWYQSQLYAFAPGSFTFPYMDVYTGTGFSDFHLVESGFAAPLLWLRAGETVYIRITAHTDTGADHLQLDIEHEIATAAANDDFANRATISGSTGSVSANLSGATSEDGEPVMYYWNGTPEPSVWYDWTAPFTGGVLLSLTPSTPLDFVEIGAYTGTSVDALTPIARLTSETVQIAFAAVSGTSYKIQAGYYAGRDASYYLSNPLDLSVLSWEPYTLPTNTTLASAIELTGATGGPLSGSTLGAPATPTDTLPDFAAIWGDNFRLGRAVFYRYTPIVSGEHVFSINSYGWDGFIAVLRGDDIASLTFDEFDGMTFGWEIDDDLDVILTAGEPVYLMFAGVTWPIDNLGWDIIPADDTWAPDMQMQGEFTLSWQASNENDALGDSLEDASSITFFPFYIYGPNPNPDDFGPITTDASGGCKFGSTIGATAEIGEPNHAGFPVTRSVWFSFEAGGEGIYEMWLEPAGSQPVEDPVLAVYEWVNFLNQLGPVMASNDNFDGLFPRLNVYLEDGGRYLLAVDSRDEGTFMVHVRRVPDSPPPANDDFADATVITEDVLIVGSTEGATVECGETPMAGWFNGPFGSVWYTFTPDEDGTAFLQATVGNNPEGNATVFDVFEGTSLSNLVNITPADDYSNGDWNDSFGFPFVFQAGVPIYIRVSTEYDGGDFGDPGDGDTFEFELLVQNPTPPVNDDGDDATDAGSGTTPGTTDGSTYEPGEPHPDGGLIEEKEPAGGTTWHKYVAPAPGFVDIYTTRPGPADNWYRVGVWEGDTRGTSMRVSAMQQDPNGFDVGASGAHQSHFEVREDQTYWIQVIRKGDQSWGAYDLHINEYLEYNDWKQDTDGFTSITNSPSISGGVMTCTGNQGQIDTLDVLPQYGTVDLGADTPEWGREVRTYFEVRFVGGQVLHREQPYGGDSWNSTTAQSDDHTATYTRRVGLMRARDASGVHRLAVSIGPSNRGENTIEFRTNLNDQERTMFAPVSLGTSVPVHDSGWVGIEVIANCHNMQNNDGTDASGFSLSGLVWTVRALVDGRPVDGSIQYRGEQIRYIDYGMYRHPTMLGYDPPITSASDQRYVENPEIWTYDMRRMRATNIVPKEPLALEFHDGLGVFEFDGFPSEVPWKSAGSRHTCTTQVSGQSTVSNTTPPIVPFPDKPGWGAVFSEQDVTPAKQAQISYGLQTSSRRIYAFSYYAEEFPTAQSTIASFNEVMARFSIRPDGELRLRPHGTREFCVAHMSLESHYYIELHVDAEVPWDVGCTVYINGIAFGTYRSSYTYPEIAALPSNQDVGNRWLTAPYASYTSVTYGKLGVGTGTHYLSNMMCGRGLPGAAFGPLQSVAISALSGVLEHHIPDAPGEEMNLLLSDGGSHSKLYNWMYEDEDAGPLNATVASTGATQVAMPVIAPRFWEAYYTLGPNFPYEEASIGAGSAWSNTGQGYVRNGDGVAVSASAQTQYLRLTRFGMSVPAEAVITGIEVRVGRRGASGGVQDLSVSIVKGYALTGTDMNQGDLIFWDTDWELVPYGGPEELWGVSWTPQDINSAGFGVAIQAEGSGTAEIDQVTIKVYFADEGGPSGIYRGTLLPPAGLYNFYGDFLVVQFDYSGAPSGGVSWPTGGWEPGGPIGGPAAQPWSSLYTLWLWQARGDKIPYLRVTGTPGQVGTATNMKIVRNALTYPRFAWSADNGASWTWVFPGESAMENHVSGDVGDPGTGDAIFMDNAAATDRWMADRGGWSSGLNEGRPTTTPAYRYPYYFIAWVGGNTDETTVHATNLWARWRGYSGYPKVAASTTGTFRMYIADVHGNTRRVGIYSGGGSFASPSIARHTQPRGASGEVWTPETFNETHTRTGYNQATFTSSFSTHPDQSLGAAVYAATWEILVPAEPDPPPSPCEGPKYTANITIKR